MVLGFRVVTLSIEQRQSRVAEASSGITTSSVISFTPRQVLLQNRNMKQRSLSVVMENDSEVKTQKAEKKKRKELRKIGLLLQSIAAFLYRKGLSRTLSSLQSEASIEVDCWKTNSCDLEDMYSKFCIASESPATAITDNSKEQDSTKDEISKKDDGEKDHKKKRKSTVGKDSENGTKSSITDGEIHKPDMNNRSCDMEDVGTEFEEKKKKKKKFFSDSLGDGIEHTAADKGYLNNENDSDQPSAKTKEKKKKGKSIPDSENVEQYPNRERLMDDVKKLDSELPQSISDGVELDGTTLKSKNKKKRKHETETDVDLKSEENRVNVKKKEQKKRKRSESEEQDYLNDDHVVDEEKAVKKADGLEDMKAIEKPPQDSQSQSTDGNRNPKKRKAVRSEEDSKKGDDANIDSKQVLQEGKEKPGVDSVVVDNGTSGPTPKTTKKENAAEPRTAKAFRRVNVNEVEFVDERLQDNSYWAKDGAETGYGAKAQEVLGQVRGRDFRHEKTKKKRGSYRGGQIDLQSHSIKFNYSDDD